MTVKHIKHHYGKVKELGVYGYLKYMFLENRSDGQFAFAMSITYKNIRNIKNI